MDSLPCWQLHSHQRQFTGQQHNPNTDLPTSLQPYQPYPCSHSCLDASGTHWPASTQQNQSRAIHPRTASNTQALQQDKILQTSSSSQVMPAQGSLQQAPHRTPPLLHTPMETAQASQALLPAQPLPTKAPTKPPATRSPNRTKQLIQHTITPSIKPTNQLTN